MIVEKEKGKIRESKVLSSLNAGEAFHFANLDLEEAMAENAIYMVSGDERMKDNRVMIMNVHDGLLLKRDGCHLVQKINMKLVVVV